MYLDVYKRQAAPRSNVIRETSDPGDIIILLGGRTGRDGCGGATGYSKAHNSQSIDTCGAEVQKGNAPTERKLQRLDVYKRQGRHISSVLYLTGSEDLLPARR